MSGELITAVLSEAIHKFGRITAINQREVSDWVRKRVQEIREGQGVKTVAHPTLPNYAERSWYETDREPGSDDE